MKKLLAVFGNPILHSKSPQLFNSAFETLTEDAYYTRINPIDPKNLIATFRVLNLVAANFTAPYKEDVMDQIDIISEQALAIGAVNTVVNKEGKLTGYNTDSYGVVASLHEAGVELNGARCIILGAGGAAKAVAHGLTEQGADVTITNRTHSKALAIADKFGCKAIEWDSNRIKGDFDVAVSTLLPSVEPPFMNDIGISVLLDASYKPSLVTAHCHAQGVKVVGGERWLVHQAAEAYRLVFGREVTPAIMDKGLEHKLAKEKLKLITLTEQNLKEPQHKQFDMIIPALWNDIETANTIIDEEIRKAFGG